MRSASLIIMIGVMIFLFAVVFAVLGRGDYQPPAPEGSAPTSGLLA